MEYGSGIRKTVSALDNARDRRETRLFKAEGLKCVRDTIEAFAVEMLVVSNSRLEELHAQRSTILEAVAEGKIIVAPQRDFQRMSHLSNPSDIIAVYRMPENTADITDLEGKLVLALDGVQDPGNLGTIMRAADWFGVRDILCSENTADPFSPKSVMASMGAISRVRPVRCFLPDVLSESKNMVYGTSLDGENIYETELSEAGIVVLGSEGHGISKEVSALVDRNLLIPSYPGYLPTSESLNVGMASAVILSEFRRRLS